LSHTLETRWLVRERHLFCVDIRNFRSVFGWLGCQFLAVFLETCRLLEFILRNILFSGIRTLLRGGGEGGGGGTLFAIRNKSKRRLETGWVENRGFFVPE